MRLTMHEVLSLCSGIQLLRRGSCHFLTASTEKLMEFSLHMTSLMR